MKANDIFLVIIGLAWGTFLATLATLLIERDIWVAIALFGIVAVVVTLGRWLYFRLWPDPDNWLGDANFFVDGQRRGEDAVHWDSKKPQTEGDDFSLNIGKRRKTHRARLVRRIWFMQTGYSATAYPKRFKVTLLNEHGFLPGFVGIEMETPPQDGIKIDLDPPRMLTHIGVGVIKPRENETWATGTIVITERRLFWNVEVTPYRP